MTNEAVLKLQKQVAAADCLFVLLQNLKMSAAIKMLYFPSATLVFRMDKYGRKPVP